MKDFEFYKKHKANYPSLENPMFTKGNFWITAAVTLLAILLEPLILYKNFRNVPFSVHYYLQQMEYFSLFAVPMASLIFWAYWREVLKRNGGYHWVGKFEVIDKQQSLFNSCYLAMAPGNKNKVKVERSLFEKIRVGDHVIVQRDVFGNVEEVKKASNFTTRLTKVRDRLAGRRMKESSQYTFQQAEQ